MADKLDEAEFWLPSEFLTDEDILMDNKENVLKSSRLCIPADFPYSFGSPVLNSPVESVVGSTETESDEEDLLLSELNRQLTLRETLELTPIHPNYEKPRVLSGSPQSTLTQVGSWSGRSTMSSNGSPNGPSQVSSPPTTPLGVNNDAWDLIFQAAGQVARLKMNGGGDGPYTRNQGLLVPPRRFPEAPSLINSSASSFNANHLKQEASGFWGRQVKNGWSYGSDEVLQNMGGRIGGMGYGVSMGQGSCGWPSQQQKNQQYVGELRMKMGGGRGVYSGCGYGYGSSSGGVSCCGGSNGNGGLKKERTGTGVFLPRRYDNNITSSFKTSDTRKRPGCSSTWVPNNKVSHVSNKNFSDMNGFVPTKSSHYSAAFIRDLEALVARRNALVAQQRRSLCPEGSINHEICLPQEWTY